MVVNTRSVAVLACYALGVLCGYYYQAVHSPDAGAATTKIPRDYLVDSKSFSEIENTKVELAALCAEFVTTWRQVRLAQVRRTGSIVSETEVPDSAILALRQGIEQFSGTPGETVLTEELLRYLAQEKYYTTFLDEYLRMSYRTPAAEALASFGVVAVSAARLTDRVGELTEALNHRASIPKSYVSDHELLIDLEKELNGINGPQPMASFQNE